MAQDDGLKAERKLVVVGNGESVNESLSIPDRDGPALVKRTPLYTSGK